MVYSLPIQEGKRDKERKFIKAKFDKNMDLKKNYFL